MGEVYLAQHPRLPRHDALKVLPPFLTADVEFRQRFIREADLAAKLFHPHIVGVHDRGEFDDQLWISMDYIDGTPCARLDDQVVHVHEQRYLTHHLTQVVRKVRISLGVTTMSHLLGNSSAHGDGLPWTPMALRHSSNSISAVRGYT